MAVDTEHLAEETREAQRGEEVIEAELRDELALRLLRDAPTSVLVNSGLAAALSIVMLGQVPSAVLAGWWGVLSVAGGLWWWYSRSGKVRSDAELVFAGARSTTVVVGIVWGAGLALASQDLPGEYTFLILVVLAGLAMVASITLVVDSLAYRLFVATMLLPPIGGLTIGSADRTDRIAAVVMAAVTLGLIAFQRRILRLICQQIRSRKRLERSEAETTRQRAYLERLFLSAPMATAVIDDQNRVRRVNPAFEQLFGYSSQSVAERDIDDLLVPESGMDTARRLTTQVQSGQVVHADVQRRTWDGQLLTVRTHASPVTGVDEPATFVVYEDITALRTAEHALRDAEEHYRGLVQSASDLVWQLDRNLAWTFVNAASQEVYGFSPQRVIGTALSERVAPERWSADQQIFEDALAGGPEISDYETVHRHADGSPRYLNFSGRTIVADDGRVTGLRGIARDVTDQVRAREALQKAQQVAEDAGEVRMRFLANMSHEIRTPLSGIIGMTEILMDSDLAPAHRASVEIVKDSADALFQIVNDVLDFSKIESDHLDLEEIRFNLPGLVSSTIKALGVNAKAGVSVTCDIATDVPEAVGGDPGRYRQILSNLVGNALKFTEEGSVSVTVTLDAVDKQGVIIRTSVRDTGIGIDADRIQHVFEEFSQADSSTTRRFGGTGLGLSIAKRLVERMGGGLTVMSEEGVGSSFNFTIRLTEEHVPVDAAQETASMEGVRVLVVADQRQKRDALRGMLESAGMIVSESVDTEAAFQALRTAAEQEQPYDLAIAGQVEGGDGFRLAERLKGDTVFAGATPVVIVTTGQPGDGRRCRELGVSGYLTEPLARVELLEVLAAVRSGRGKKLDELVTRHSIKETRNELRILVAEDNPVNQRVAATMLGRRGHHVDVVNDGVEAVEAVSAKHYDVVLMDVQMPRLDGYAATAKIRELPGKSDLPVIAVTAHAFSQERERCAEAGMDGYLGKPYKPHELFSVVERWDVRPGGSESAAIESASDGETRQRMPVDVTELYRMMREADVEEAVPEMIEVYLQDASTRIVTLEEAVRSGEPGDVEKAAHAFKSASGSIRAMDLMEMLKELEADARDGSREAFETHGDRIRGEYEAVRTYLEAHMADRTDLS